MPTVRNFSGALNTRVDPALINSTEARVFHNIDSDTSVLTPIKDSTPRVSGAQRYAYFSVADQEWQFSSTPTDWVEFKEVLYTADRVNAPTKKVNGTTYNLGIAAPSGTVTFVTDDAAEAPTDVKLEASFTGTGGLTDNEYKYKIVSRKDGKESPSFLTEEVELTSIVPRTIIVRGRPASASNLSAADRARLFRKLDVLSQDTVTITAKSHLNDDYRVYRNLDGRWYAVTNAWTTIGSPVVDDILDISANEELEEIQGIDGTVQYALTYYSTITGAESAPLLTDEVEVFFGTVQLNNIPVSSDPQVDTVRIYRIGGALTSFTRVDSISNGTTTYLDELIETDVEGSLLGSEDYDVAPTGLKYLTESYAMLFGAVGDQLRFTPIGEPDAWPTQFFLDFPVDITGISKTVIGLLVHTEFTTFLVTGTGPTAFAQQLLSGDQGCISHDSIVETVDSAIWASTDGICASDGSTVKVLTRDKLGKFLTTPINAVIYDQVYYLQQTDGSTFALDFERNQLKTFSFNIDSVTSANDILYGHDSGSLVELNSAEATLSFDYQSPDFFGAGLTVPKLYKDVQMFSTGKVTAEVFVNGQSAGVFTRTTTDSHELKIDKNLTRGFYISFKLSGTGTVRALSWIEGSANA